MLEALFKLPVETQSEPHVCRTRHCSSHITKADDETRLRKKERTEMGQSRKSSLMDEEIRLKKAQKIVAGASNSILESGPSRTIDGVEIEEDETTDGSILRDVGTTKGSTISNPMGSERLDPPTC